MLTYNDQMQGLNGEQLKATKIDVNAVVAAGAGSGKTRVLASRFLHLVVEKKVPVERILALTYTKKAAAEMRGRIYLTLRQTESEEARAAADTFYSAQIHTLDSFCSTICRTACRQYGISPDFAIDDEGIAERSRQAAISFILQHRTSLALISLMQKFSIEDIADRLFVAAIKEHSSLSAPLNFEKIAREQKEAVRKEFAATVSSIISLYNLLNELSLEAKSSSKPSKTWDKLNEELSKGLSAVDIADGASIAEFVKACANVASVKNSFRAEEAKDALNEFKEKTGAVSRLANFILNEKIIEETFALLREFQDIFNGIKRAVGALTFRDLSQMAVDALKGDEALLRFWNGQFDYIMIDEFQDNNKLQKDLLYLLSDEGGERDDEGIPKPESLKKDKLFFVGDEKQSIYRFRGADVSVFKQLKTELDQGKEMPQLRINYRTEKRLLDVFNSIFERVFLPASAGKDYEAEFSSLDPATEKPSAETEGRDACLEVTLFANERFDKKDKEHASKIDCEAQVVAEKIEQLHGKGYKYSDIAILFRSTAKQRRFEQALRDKGIPFMSESLTGLFSDAPANDFYSLLRLACNPEDAFSYAAVLRSPFAAVDDESFTRIMAARSDAAGAGCKPALPFSEADAAFVAERYKEKFKRAADIYAFAQEKADKISIAQLVSALWYDFGYRYSVISDPSLMHYCEIYDYFFELARQADAKAASLSDFLDSIEKKRKENERFDEIDLPAAKGEGVRLMTVHKSKGLEFPIVFIVDAGNRGRTDANAEPFYFSGKHSITINTETPDELKGVKDIKKGGGNFFYMEAKAENDDKAAAETRRLLYVAMTRAESNVFVSGCVNLKPKSEELPRDKLSEDELRKNIARRLEEKKKKSGDEEARHFSFLDLLLPALVNAGKIEDVSIKEELPKLAQRKKREPEATHASLIEGVECVDYKVPKRTRYAASELYSAKRELGVVAATESASEPAESSCDDALDALLKKHNISHADFGTHVHAAIEEGFTGHPARIPQEVREAAVGMAERFFASDIGKAAKAASWRQTEFGFAIKTDVDGLGSCVVNGKMDLVFEKGGALFVVDYKTDKEENPAVYMDQIETYKKAARGLFAGQFPDDKVEGALFYLRSGNVVRV